METNIGPHHGILPVMEKLRHLPFLLNRTVIVYFTVLTSIVGAANNTQGPQLEVLYVTPFKGFIQTPGFDGVKPHPQNMDSWVRVDVPQNHTVMLNIRDIDLTLKPYDSVCDWRLVQLTVYKRTMSDEDIIFKCVNPFGYWPELYPHMEVFYVHFVSKDVKPKTGFRISFSFHNESFLPEIAGHDYMWIFNCSVPHYKDFEHHFTCNLKDDCIAREDEEFCSYRSDMCGPGLISVSGMCMSFERANTSKFSWNDAYASCLKKGGRLAVLNTPEIWTAAADLLEKTAYYYKMFYQIIVGLRSASPSLPFMYRNEFQWTDGTIAYYRAIRNINIWPSCFVLSAQNYKNRMDMKPCGKNAPYSNYMCSMDQDSTGEGASDLSTPEIQMSTDNSNEYKQVRCPSGHMTHDFLACDVKSACWERESSCEVPLSPLPPTFMCDNQVERVPYTLVCDFRADCSDDSDEEFCVYQQCAEKEPFYCNDKQCVSVTVVCDGQQQCMNGADEDLCSAYSFGVFRNPPPPALRQEIHRRPMSTNISQAVSRQQAGEKWDSGHDIWQALHGVTDFLYPVILISCTLSQRLARARGPGARRVADHFISAPETVKQKMRDFATTSAKYTDLHSGNNKDNKHHDSVPTFFASHQNGIDTKNILSPSDQVPLPPPHFVSVPQIQIGSGMDTLKGRSGSGLTNAPLPVNSSKAHHGSKSGERHLFERRERVVEGRVSPRPAVVHPNIGHAQTESEHVFQFAEDSRPMFSPVPREMPDGEDSPKTRAPKDKTSFPSIHVEKCEKTQPTYAASLSPEPVSLTPDSDLEVEPELAALSQGRDGAGTGSAGRLYVPSPFQKRRTDGRAVLLTRDSGQGLLGSWSRSEGNLPDAVRRSSSSPGGHTNLLDIRYRPDWVTRPSLRPSSDVALHELRRERNRDSRSPTPRRLTVRLEPLNPGQRALSASNLNSP
ncbi:hypothetical protein BaRGS_00002860 [Batillaria attramentaria]|uniref:C-type lectin domain-containing protein n=1 Tax=Batillaria attramentaria TaxID=370345 RepID=A0ABD0M375_9CAEN